VLSAVNARAVELVLGQCFEDDFMEPLSRIRELQPTLIHYPAAMVTDFTGTLHQCSLEQNHFLEEMVPSFRRTTECSSFETNLTLPHSNEIHRNWNVGAPCQLG